MAISTLYGSNQNLISHNTAAARFSEAFVKRIPCSVYKILVLILHLITLKSRNQVVLHCLWKNYIPKNGNGIVCEDHYAILTASISEPSGSFILAGKNLSNDWNTAVRSVKYISSFKADLVCLECKLPKWTFTFYRSCRVRTICNDRIIL